MNLKETYNHIAEDWHKDHADDTWWVEGTEKFISFLKPGDRVLDVGCAGGIKSAHLISKGFNVTGIDLSEKMVEIAKKENPTGIFFPLDLADVDQLQESFEGIFVQAVLLHVPKQEIHQRLESLVAKLAPGGYLYVAVKERNPDQPEEEIKTENDYGYDYQRFFSYFTPEEIGRNFKDVGLEVVSEDILPSGNTRWIQVIGKKATL